jgi:protein TonB
VILKKVRPVYSEMGRLTRTEGTVILDCLIGTDGRVHDVKVISSLRFLDEEAVKAVKQWEFRPAMLNGRPVDVYFVLTVHFRLAE